MSSEQNQQELLPTENSNGQSLQTEEQPDNNHSDSNNVIIENGLVEGNHSSDSSDSSINNNNNNINNIESPANTNNESNGSNNDSNNINNSINQQPQPQQPDIPIIEVDPPTTVYNNINNNNNTSNQINNNTVNGNSNNRQRENNRQPRDIERERELESLREQQSSPILQQHIQQQQQYERENRRSTTNNNTSTPTNTTTTHSNNYYHRNVNNSSNNNEPRDIAINENQDTMFDVILQWVSLAVSKLMFHPIEFPIHALTTFIQANPTPQPQPIGIPLQLPQLLQQPPIMTTSDSLWKLFKQKGYHIYDGGLVYLLHNMVVIIFNFTQRFVNSAYNTPPAGNASFSLIERRKRIGTVVDVLLSLVKNALTLPLDVLMSRLIVHRFYKSDNLHYINDCTLSGICKNEGIIRGLYAGWEVVVLKSLLEWLFKKCDNHLLQSSRRGPFSPNEKSPTQILLLCVKILLDYILTVIKVRLNIRNIGFFKTLATIYRREGIRGLFSGLNTYFVLFPLWMIGILFANVIFIKLKQMLERNADLSRRRRSKSGVYTDNSQPTGMIIALSPMVASDDEQSDSEEDISESSDTDDTNNENNDESEKRSTTTTTTSTTASHYR